jgi:hypothetical protein
MIPTQNIIFIYVMYRITRTMLEVAFEKAEKRRIEDERK